MGLKLYWMPISQPARCVAWALEYAGVEYESINVMPGKETRTPEYMEKSGGIGTVPMIEVCGPSVYAGDCSLTAVCGLGAGR